MNLAVCVLTIICLLTIIGSGSIVFSLIYETNTITQYVPTQPTRLHHYGAKNNTELEQDIAKNTFIDNYFDDDELEIAEEIEIE